MAVLVIISFLLVVPGGQVQAQGIYDTIPQSDLRNLVNAMDSYRAFDSPNDSYTGVTEADLEY